MPRHDSSLSYLGLPHSLTIPIWKEARALGEIIASRRAPASSPAAITHDVLLVAGFLDDGRSMRHLAGHLREAGHRVTIADIGANIDCTEKMAGRLEHALDDAVAAAGGPVVLVGHSRGGVLARVVTVRHPEKVAGLIAVGSPLSRPHDITIVLRLIKLGMRYASRLGVPGLIGECAFGECCAEFNQQLIGPFPSSVPFTSIYSRSDGMVAAAASADPAADLVVLDLTHVGLVTAPAGIAAIERALATIPAAVAA